MEKRIQLEKRGRKEGSITDLNLDNCRSTQIVGLSDEFTSLQTLSLINVGLTTLKGLPKLPKLKTLELSDNRISSGLTLLESTPKLVYLNLSGNKIKDLDELKPLESLKNLTVLDLFYNEVTTVENYKEKIFAMLPSLKYLDGFDCDGAEAPSSEGDEEDEVNGNDSKSEDDEILEDSFGESSSEEEGVSLAYVYKENLEDDSSEYEDVDIEEEEEDVDEDYDDEEENCDEEKDKPASSTAEDPSQQARGKKRKHEG